MRLADHNRDSGPGGEVPPALLHRGWRLASKLVTQGRFRWGWRILVVLLFVLPAMMLMIFSIRNHVYTIIYACITLMSWLLSLAVLHILIMHRRAEDAPRSMAVLDELTGLANRRGFMSLAALRISTGQRLGQKLFLAYVDLNRMKDINDRFGHNHGDLALIDTAEILRATFRDTDVKARLGGDEFVVLGVVKAGFSPQAIQQRLHAFTAGYLAYHRRPYELSFSTGIAMHDPENDAGLEDLMERADRCMYEIKSKRQDRVSKAEMLSVTARYAATKN